MELETYRRKRNFKKTAEPVGKKRARSSTDLSFVVQKHAASRLHYDFRLEMGGVLASWAVPKGPSLNPKERRLAVEVEDHPMEYGDFEGTIPQGEYGAGSVIVWDHGRWTPEGDPIEDRRKGRLKFHLNGEKLKGGWTLIRMKPRGRNDDKNNWLLIKERDQNAGKTDIVSAQPQSVKSGKTIERQMTEARQPKKIHARGRAKSAQVKAAKKSNMPAFYKQQLATLVASVPQGDDWLHEIKLDGYRIICRIDNGRASLLTRKAHDWTGRFGAIADAVKALPVRQAVLDGEIVALQNNGISDFQLLQNALREKSPVNLVYFVFDLLYLDGSDLTAAPLLERKEKLQKLLKGKQADERVRFSEHWIGRGNALFDKACESGLEGIIAKRTDQPYQPTRSRDWLKIKCLHSQEFVIGGFTDPAGSRSGLGALLLGVYDDEGSLHYTGRVGTGFTERTLADLRERLDKVVQKNSPFVDALPRGQTKYVHWVKPRLVGEVAFTQWTQDNLLRHPTFQGIREDKPAVEVRREKIASTSKLVSSNTSNNTDPELEIAGIKLSHPDRVLYPAQGITKIELARYYEEIADWILPHIAERPLTLVRCPEGHKKQCFYQRHARDSLDEAIQPVKVKEKGSIVSYVAIDSLRGLIALVQIGVLEIHTWGSRRRHVERPDQLIFDLDPDPTVSWNALKDAALMLRARLTDVGLGAFLKTTGGKGLHVVVPITPKHDWNFAKKFAKSMALSIVRENPDRFIATMSKAKRKGKIFIDYLRNAKTATAVAAYSTRARSGAPVSTPLRWQELKDDVRLEFTIRTLPKRLARVKKDPWDGFEAARATITDNMLRRV